jgi:hypothetical protein
MANWRSAALVHHWRNGGSSNASSLDRMNAYDYLRAFDAILEIENRDLTGDSLTTEEKARIVARRFYDASKSSELIAPVLSRLQCSEPVSA